MTDTDGLLKLREPFAENQIGKLPKPYSKDSKRSDCKVCGGYHGQPAMHIDYVGHAAITSRLLEVDPLWSWEPVAFDDGGLPRFDQLGGLWIRLTVLGVTRLGYGDAQGKKGGDAVKEAIGDALRNAAMRFGTALELWHKGDLYADESDDPTPAPAPDPAGAARAELLDLLASIDIAPGEAAERFAADGHGEIGRSTDVAAIRALTAHYAQIAGKS
ncbi:hypothetical protein [Nocardia australiensis]|uniref:hypothetical protein n=1 Tax=Nocardia australiensis TaxID=2887191 RepID=UPI001D1434C2|nr:hypothetical protein [Nocardia australiensis]